MKLNKIYQGDTLKVLKTFPNDFVDTIVTSPPYWGLRDYGVKGQIGLEPTLGEYLDKMLAVTKQLHRVLKPTGVMFWNHGDNYSTTPAGNKEFSGYFGSSHDKEAGFKAQRQKRYSGIPTKCLCLQNYRLILKMIDTQNWILRNVICWWKPNAMPSSVKDRFSNAYEPIFMLVKNNKAQYYYNVKTGLMADRKPKEPKENVDWYWKKHEACNGRGCDNRRCVDGQIKESYWKSLVYWFDLDAARKPHKAVSIARASRGVSDKNKYTKGAPGQTLHSGINKPRLNKKYQQGIGAVQHIEGRDGMVAPLHPSGKNPGDVWRIPTSPFPAAHFATFPPKLIEPMVKSSCPMWICKKCGKARVRVAETEYKNKSRSPKETDKYSKIHNYRATTLRQEISYKTIGWTDCGCGKGWKAGIVLDPFIGSGTTALVARKHGRNWIGIELSKEYIKIAEKRLQQQHLGL